MATARGPPLPGVGALLFPYKVATHLGRHRLCHARVAPVDIDLTDPM
jgi:hypothetical protein